MTDEQIKQNAGVYVKEHFQFDNVEDAFIAGAHSRDEEIKELNSRLEARREELFQRQDKDIDLD